MTAAFLLVMMIGSNPAVEPPKFVLSFTSVESCVIAADKRNRGGAGDSGSIAKGNMHYCVKILFPV